MNDQKIIAEGKSKLLKAVLDQSPMKNLIKLGEELLGNPLILCTNNHYIWHVGLLPSGCGMQGKVGDSMNVAIFPENLFGDYATPKRLPSPGGQYCLQFCLMSNKGVSRGYSFLVEEKPFEPWIGELHQAFCDILNQSMEKLEHSGIMLQATPEEIALIRKLEDPNYTVNDNIRLGALRSKSRYMEIIACSFEDRLISYAPNSRIISDLKKLLGADICFGFSRHIVAMVPYLTAQSVRGDLIDFLGQNGMLGGVSYPFSHNSDLKLYLSQATDVASRWAERDDRLVNYTDRFFQNMLMNQKAINTLDGYCRFSIYNIRKYDSDTGTELLPTIKAYFNANLSIRKTASTLGIHRNSALARIQKIRSMLLSGTDLSMGGYFSTLTAELLAGKLE